MRLGMTGRVVAAGALALLYVSAVFGLLVLTIFQIGDAADASRVRVKAIAAATNLERLVVDINSGVRAFVATGDERALDPSRAAQERLPAAEQKLVGLGRDDPAQSAAAATLVAAVDDYRDSWAVPAVAAARSDPERANSRAGAREGDRRWEEIETAFSRFANSTITGANGHIERTKTLTARAIEIGGGGLTGFVLLLTAILVYFTRTATAPVRSLAAAARRIGTGDLRVRVPEQGGAEIGELVRSFNEMAASIEEGRDELDHFFSISLDLLAIAGTDGMFTRLNPAWEHVLGYTTEELLSRPFIDFVHPDDREATLAETESLNAGANTTQFENRYRRKDGSYRWLVWTAAAEGNGGSIYAVARDITKRKRAQQEIQTLNEQLGQRAAELERTLAALARERDTIDAFLRFGEELAAESEVGPLASTIVSQAGDYANADAAALYVVDDEHDDVHNLVSVRGFDRTCLAPTVGRGEGLTGRALAGLNALRDERGASGLRLAEPAGELPVLHELHIPLVYAGRAVGALVLARTDAQGFSPDELAGIGHLADQSAIALASALTLRRARRIAEINKAVLDATTDGVTMLDGEGRVIVSNKAMRRLADVLGAAPGDSTEIVARVGQRTTDPDAFHAAIEKRRDDPLLEISDEFTITDPPRTIGRYSAPVRAEDGSVAGRIIVLRDMTAEREAERFKDELVATVSHELRTPLTGILGFSELLVSQDVDAATRTRHLETIHQEARRLTDLVNDFLDVERFAFGKVELERKTFSLPKVLETAIALFDGQSETHTLELELGDGPLDVRGDANRTAQVVANLLSNAIKYSPAGGTVAVAAARNGETIRATVSDRGLGIPAEQQHRVFEKFFRVHSTDTREIGGTGLGLTLAKDIVEAQDGTIGFESEPGAGSTFWFELPAA